MMSEAGVADDAANHGISQRHIQKEIRHEDTTQGSTRSLLIIITKDSTRSEEAIALGI